MLAEVPYRHSGKGVVRKQALSGATWMGGAFNDTFGTLTADPRKVKGGADMPVPKFAKWFVCEYAPGVVWWEELAPGLATSGCTIQIRDKQGRDPMDAKLVCNHRK